MYDWSIWSIWLAHCQFDGLGRAMKSENRAVESATARNVVLKRKNRAEVISGDPTPARFCMRPRGAYPRPIFDYAPGPDYIGLLCNDHAMPLQGHPKVASPLGLPYVGWLVVLHGVGDLF